MSKLPDQPDVSGPIVPNQDAGSSTVQPLRHLRRNVFLVLVVLTILGIGVAAIRDYTRNRSQSVTIPVSNTDLSLFEVVDQANLTITTIAIATLPTDTITTTDVLSGSVVVQSVKAGEPITDGQVLVISDLSLISNTLAVAIEGGPALTFGGQLRPGMVLSAWKDGDNTPLVDRLLLLDVKELNVPRTSNVSPRYLLVLAVPPDDRDQIIVTARHGVLSLTPVH